METPMLKTTKIKALLGTLFMVFLIGCGGSSSSTPENNDSSSDNPDNNSSSNIEVKKSAYLASDDEDYTRLGLKKERVEAWEDSLRTDGKSGSFEWWYSDFLFDDGTSVVVVFYTKLSFDTYGMAHPMASISVHYPDGTKAEDFYLENIGTEINASKTITDVHIGKSYLTNREGDYLLHFEKDGLIFDAKMVSNLPMTRPKTGFIYFGDDKSKHFAWLPAQISSNVEATLTTKEKTSQLLGLGYHDHNWGNTAMHEIINHWHWGRAKINDYTVVFFDIVANSDFNNSKIPLFLVAKDNKFIEMDSPISVQKSNISTHALTNKKYAKNITITQTDTNGTTYSITTTSKEDLTFLDMNRLPFEIGNSPTYLRSLSDFNLTITQSNGEKTEQSSQGIVEQMSFDDTIDL